MDAHFRQIIPQPTRGLADKTSADSLLRSTPTPRNSQAVQRKLMDNRIDSISVDDPDRTTPPAALASAPPTQSPAPQSQPTSLEETRALSRRAILIGMLLVIFVAAFTPYNDSILKNSRFIGNHFPIGIMTLMAAIMLIINPLLGIMKRRRLARGELIVIMTMMLVGAAAPSSGLMRYLEPMILAPARIAQNYQWLKPLVDLFPSALVPSRDPNSTIINSYALGIDPVRNERIPVAAFILPGLLWSILIAALMGAAFFLAAIFRKQWVHHERLTYPLATIPLELLAAPDEGKLYNNLWRNSLLWAGAAIPLLVYFLKGMHAQFPAVPDIMLQFDVRAAFTDRPWDALPPFMTQAQVYFAAVGICFFIPAEIAFSMWFFLVANGLIRVFFARSSFDPGAGENNRAIGTYIAYFAGLLWLARGHFKYVLVSAWKKSPRAEGEPLTYRTMVLGLMICNAVAWLWLMAVGMSPAMALLLLAVGTMLVTLMARIVAETGLFYVGPIFWASDFFTTLLGTSVISKTSMFWAQISGRLFFADLRENIMPYAANALRMGQEITDSDAPRSATAGKPRIVPAADTAGGPRWIRWMLLSLVVSILVSGAMHHYLSYSRGRIAIDDDWASNRVPREALQETFAFYSSPRETSLASAWTQVGLGSVMATALMAGRMLWAGWPFHPIGLVLMNSGPMHVLWFSIFLGWGVKRLLLRYGGAGAFRRARPFFIGLIVGETLAAGIWMFIGLATNGAVRFTFLPG